MTRHDVLIVGAGPVGLALALALRDSGLDVAIADVRPADAIADDPRILALAYGTRLTLERLGVWSALPATPIRSIHVSQQGGFGRTIIQAHDHDLPALGYVVSAGALGAALRRSVESTPAIHFLDATEVTTRQAADQQVRVGLRNTRDNTTHSFEAHLVACAEGGLQGGSNDVAERDYGQHALIATVTLAHDHHQRAFERFTTTGPLALLPHGDQYALVHGVAADQADALLALDDDAYIAHLHARLGPRIRISALGARARYPLALRYRRTPVGPRTAWLGNAAQTLHPVAGQGFNLALRDVSTLATLIAEHPGDPGDPALLARYARGRKLDRYATMGFTDTLIRVFGSDVPLLRHLRGAGLLALDTVPPLRQFIARRMMFGARAWP
ncbi:MAG: FAD-dependent monooxygenase [Rhodocyclales bacterium]|nr:FAD-dependent monooxygenase [Rhodocyclales bacterium]